MIYLPRSEKIVRPTPMECTGLGLGIGFGAGGRSIDPRSYAGLAAWFRADLGVSIATGISQWLDQSGAGDASRHLAQASGPAQPTLVASDAAYNNQSTVAGNGATWLETGTWSSTFGQPTTIVAVGSAVGSAGTILYDGKFGGQRQSLLNNTANKWGMYAGGAIIGATADCTTKSVAAIVFNGGSSSLYVNSSAAPTDSGNVGANSLNYLSIFAASGGVGVGGSPKLAELICYSRALSQPEIADLFRYASSRYGGSWS